MIHELHMQYTQLYISIKQFKSLPSRIGKVPWVAFLSCHHGPS